MKKSNLFAQLSVDRRSNPVIFELLLLVIVTVINRMWISRIFYNCCVETRCIQFKSFPLAHAVTSITETALNISESSCSSSVSRGRTDGVVASNEEVGNLFAE